MKFLAGIHNIASLSLILGYPTQASVAHSVMTAFKNLAAVSMEGGYEFEEAKQLIEMAKDPSKFIVEVEVAEVVESTPVVEEEVKEEEEEEEEFDLGAGGLLFGEEEDEEWP